MIERSREARRCPGREGWEGRTRRGVEGTGDGREEEKREYRRQARVGGKRQEIARMRAEWLGV